MRVILAAACVCHAFYASIVVAAERETTGKDIGRAEKLEFFERKIRPLLSEHCYECHSAAGEKLQAGLRVDNRESLISGGDSGAAIEPGNPHSSLLVEALKYESYEMPPSGKLSDAEIKAVEKWISDGAVWPEEEIQADTLRPKFDLQQRRASHWAWQPMGDPMPPKVEAHSWPKHSIDNFILSKLESAGLQPAPAADRNTLIRRLSFDLIGLPPTPEQIDSFLSDSRPDAVERLVDRLLASEHFGERWGRNWLDLVRYAESRGHEFDEDAENAYQYRDYVIRALNADLPYDDFVREHIAGDLLPNPRLHPTKGFNESILGTGFWFLGEWVHSPVDIRKDESDRFDNMIDVMSKTFLGVTVACARCHDHKFDAISTADYYSLSGFLQSSDYHQVRFETLEHNKRIAGTLEKKEHNFRSQISSLAELPNSDELLAELDSKTELSGLSPQVIVDYTGLFRDTIARPDEPGSSSPSPGASDDGWMQYGFTFGGGPQQAGAPRLRESGDVELNQWPAATNDSIWSGLESSSEPSTNARNKLRKIDASGRTLRSPTFRVQDGVIHCYVQGAGDIVACVDSHRLVAGPLHGETIVKVNDKPGPQWIRLNLTRYIGHRVHLEFTPAKDATLSVSLVSEGDISKLKSAIEKSRTQLGDLVSQHQSRLDDLAKATDDPGKRFKGIAKNWSRARRNLKKKIRLNSQTAMAMVDGSPEDDTILIRGSSSNPGDIVARQMLTALNSVSALPPATPSRSGRLGLAEQINAPDNPLSTRVIVNRIWHHLLGRGIVATTDDFGVLGMRPTHPELLDHLAQQFLDNGRSIKGLIKTICLSQTYQMSGDVTSKAKLQDPKNLLLHHRVPKRLEGEIIRDALLAISGKLDKTQFGPPVPIHLTAFMEGRGRPSKSGPMDGDCRRTIYVAVRRNFLSPFSLAFDTPVPFSTMGRRNSSNVPAQSLILLNDPLVHELSTAWATKIASENASTADRINALFLTAFARSPTDQEYQVASAFLQDDSSSSDSSQRLSEFAHALINAKEFIFVR
ncbi:MAG: PSD1 and planctomycete cytochrome C domain-containing protein [Aureliella sp.]